MAALVSIGEFARLTHLSVKALRHYHDVGVLIPAEIDRQSGYRRYSVAQLAAAHLVRRLRELDLPLDAIRTIIEGGADARNGVLIAHLNNMEVELARTRELVASLRQLIEAPLRPFDVEIRTIDTVRALAVRATVALSDIDAWSVATFGQIAATLGETGIAPAGEFGALYTKGTFENGEGEVTAFAPLAPGPPPRSSPDPLPFGILTSIAGGTYATAVHRGPYADLDRTYGALGAYVAEHLTSAPSPIREHYLVGPDDVTDDADLQTMVLWPIEL